MDPEDFDIVQYHKFRYVDPFALISEVKKYPALYNNRIPEYDDAPMKEEIWESVNAVLFPNYKDLNEEAKSVIKETVLKRWKSLRKAVIEDHSLRMYDPVYRKMKMNPMVEEMMFIIPDEDYTLISEVKKYPALYNNRIPEYDDAAIKEEIWELINAVLFPNYNKLNEETKIVIKESVRTRWKSFRNAVMKDHRLREEDAVYRKTKMNPLVEEMQFIIPYVNYTVYPSALISEVKKYPALYNNRITEYGNALMKEEIWESIKVVLFPNYKELNEEAKGIIKETVRKRWKSLRKALIEDHRLREKDAVYRQTKMTPIVEEMQFIIPYVKKYSNTCHLAKRSNEIIYPEDFEIVQYHKICYVDPFALISEVKKYPALYNNRIADYDDTPMKEEIWESINAVLFSNYKQLKEEAKGVKKETVRKRWKSLRNTAIKDHRLREDDPVYRKRKMTPIVKEMQFIIPYVKKYSHTWSYKKKRMKSHEPNHSSDSCNLMNDSTIDLTFQEDPEYSYSLQVDDDEEQSTNEAFNPSVHMAISEGVSEESELNADACKKATFNYTIDVEGTEINPEERKLIHKRKRTDSEEDLHSKLNELIDRCNEDSEDEDQMFLIALLADFKKIPVTKKLKVKKAFITALDEALE